LAHSSPGLIGWSASSTHGPTKWSDHFRLGQDEITIIPLTEEAEATVRIFGINLAERLIERFDLHASARYPSGAARERMRG